MFCTVFTYKCTIIFFFFCSIRRISCDIISCAFYRLALEQLIFYKRALRISKHRLYSNETNRTAYRSHPAEITVHEISDFTVSIRNYCDNSTKFPFQFDDSQWHSISLNVCKDYSFNFFSIFLSLLYLLHLVW